MSDQIDVELNLVKLHPLGTFHKWMKNNVIAAARQWRNILSQCTKFDTMLLHRYLWFAFYICTLNVTLIINPKLWSVFVV